MTANKDDADFLQSLAAVAMSVKDATVSNEMTCPKDNARPQQLPETFRRRRVAAPQRQILAAIAANSLRGAIDRSQTHARSSERIFLLCQWYIISSSSEGQKRY